LLRIIAASEIMRPRLPSKTMRCGSLTLPPMSLPRILPLLLALCATTSLSAEITRVWLTHRTNDPAKLCVNWITDTPGDSVVRYGATPSQVHTERIDERVTLHHVEVPFGDHDGLLYYSVETNGVRSAVANVQYYNGQELRVAVVADWQAQPDLSALHSDRPHLLMVAGDQIGSLHGMCGAGVKDCVKPFAALVAKYPALFATVPVMPALGNHDREIRPRGPKPPDEPVYDVEATAWRAFYPLPDDGWKWRFDIPAFDIRFLALDLNHTQDQGTTWQTNHPFDRGSAQFEWYREHIARRDREFVITLQNERNVTVRGFEKGEWGRMLGQGSAVISGFGYFAERAEVGGVPFFNTALGVGAKYPDPQSKFFASEASYVLLRFERGKKSFVAELKNLAGDVLDRSEWPALDRR
jgi:hypothetical protein